MFKPRTVELYRGLLKNHLRPTFGNVDLADIRDADVRRWRKERLDAGPRQARPFGPVTVAKAYRLLHGIMTTAVEDGLSAVIRARSRAPGKNTRRTAGDPDRDPGRAARQRARHDTGRCCSWRRSRTCVSVNSRAWAEPARPRPMRSPREHLDMRKWMTGG